MKQKKKKTDGGSATAVREQVSAWRYKSEPGIVVFRFQIFCILAYRNFCLSVTVYA